MVSRRYGVKGETRGIQTERLVRGVCENECKVTLVSEAGVTVHDESGERVFQNFEAPSGIWKDRVSNKLLRGGARSQWSIFAAEQVRQLRKSQTFDAVVSLSTPFESHLSVLDSKCWAAVPWAAFFSDPWPPHTLPAPYARWRDYLSAPVQSGRLAEVLSRVKVIASPSFHVLSEMEKIDSRDRERCLLPHMVPALEESEDSSAWSKTLFHCGTLTPERISQRLLSFLRVASDVLDGSDWRVSFVGRGSRALQEKLGGAPAARLDVGDTVPHSEAKRMVEKAGILLVVEADMRRSPFVPSKLAEALASRRPVICFSPDESAARQLTKGEEGVYFVSPNEASDVDKIRSVMTSAMERAQRPLVRDCSRFSEKAVAERLLTSLERAMRCFQPSL